MQQESRGASMHRSRSIIPIVAAGLLLGLSAAAVAAAPKKPPPPPPPPPAWSWTGFYVGGNVGYGWGSSSVNATFVDTAGIFLSTGSTTVHPDGVIGGGQIGYNWQSGNWVPGFEADIQGSGQRGSGTITCAAGVCTPVPVTVSLT